jgi:hypothetical protein
MLADDLEQKGRQIISELGLEHGASTQKWMAHYIAELMHRSEHADTDEERSQAAFRCAEIIARLWDSRLNRARSNILSQLYSGYRAAYEKWEFADTVKEILRSPTEQTYPSELWEKSLVLGLLLVPERYLLWLITYVELHNQEHGPQESIDEDVMDLYTDEERCSVVLRHLQDMFADAKDLDVRNTEQVEQFVGTGLRSIHIVRDLLLI